MADHELVRGRGRGGVRVAELFLALFSGQAAPGGVVRWQLPTPGPYARKPEISINEWPVMEWT
jgi:hypothetical protein